MSPDPIPRPRAPSPAAGRSTQALGTATWPPANPFTQEPTVAAPLRDSASSSSDSPRPRMQSSPAQLFLPPSLSASPSLDVASHAESAPALTLPMSAVHEHPPPAPLAPSVESKRRRSLPLAVTANLLIPPCVDLPSPEAFARRAIPVVTRREPRSARLGGRRAGPRDVRADPSGRPEVMPSTGSAALGSAPKGVERAEQDVGLGHGGKGGQVGQQVLSYGSARSPSPDEDDMRSLRKWVLHPERPDVELRKDLVRAEERHGRITAMLLAYLHTLQDVSSQNESDAWPPSGDTLGLCVPAFNQVEGFDSIEPVDPNDNPFLRRLFRGDLQPGSLAASFWHWVEAHAPPSPSTVSRFAECINRLSDSAGRAILRAAAFEAILRLIPARHEQDRSTRLWILYALGAEDKVYDYYCGLGPLVSSENCQFPRKRAHDADSPHAITANRYSLFVSAWEAAANPHENLPGSFLDAYARFALDDAVARAGDRTMDVHVSEQPLPAGVREGVLRAYPAPDQAARRPFYYLGAYLADKLKAPWDTMSVLFTKAKKTTAKVGGTDWDRYVGFVNIKNCHWVAIVIDAGKRTYSVYDPLGISNPDVLKMLRTMTNGLTQDGIVPSDGRQWQVNSIQGLPRQSSPSRDCAIFCLAFFEMLLKPPGTKAWPAEYMPALRRKYLVDLACGKVLNVPGIDLRVMAEGIAREAKWERMDG